MATITGAIDRKRLGGDNNQALIYSVRQLVHGVAEPTKRTRPLMRKVEIDVMGERFLVIGLLICSVAGHPCVQPSLGAPYVFKVGGGVLRIGYTESRPDGFAGAFRQTGDEPRLVFVFGVHDRDRHREV